MALISIAGRIGDTRRPSATIRDLEWKANSYGFQRGANRGLIGGQHFPPFLECGDNTWRQVRGLRKLAWRPFQNVAGLSALVGAHSLSSTVWARAACRCLTEASVGPNARVRLPYDADKLFDRVGIGRRLDSIDRFHQVARRLVNWSSSLATAAEPSEQSALPRFAPSFAVPFYWRIVR
jgi:hypothetical protein